MCGIAGILVKKGNVESHFERFSNSSNLMSHRGPDYKGQWQQDNLLLIHHRLSIIDLDPRSHQPFSSGSKRFTGVYNGEVYNFRDLLEKETIHVRTSSDTEVVFETFEKSGHDAIVSWNGIFALALYDKQLNKLHLIRDRLGIKPLYLFEDDSVIAFASEAKVILDWLDTFKISKQGLSEFLWYGNTTGSQTMVEGLKKVEPGSHLTYDLNSGAWEKIHKYWEVNQVEEVKMTEEEAVENIQGALEKAIQRQLVADVPLGILLSGGIDSSSIVGYASRHYTGNLDTYSIDYDYNIGGKSELEKARLISQKFGTKHHELQVRSDDVKSIFEKLVIQYDEPFADTAAIPLYQLARECSQDKKVILQGDGGDELFAGYRRYNILASYHFWKLASVSHHFMKSGRLKERMKRMSFILNQPDDAHLMAYFLTQDVPYKSPYQILNGNLKDELLGYNPFVAYEKAALEFANQDRVQKLLYTDMTVLLPNTYLEKVDKATMLCSIEARVPFLDNELVELALSIPSSLKVKNKEKKYLLKKALKGMVPDEILYGPKRGFDVPYKQWLKTDLYEFAESNFREMRSDILDCDALLKLLELHRKGVADYGPLLWKSLVLTYWLNHYSGKISFS